MKEKKVALFLWRFQPWHIGHRDALERILLSYDHVKIVIGSANESRTERNPWTSKEREKTIQKSIEDIYTPETISFFELDDVPDDDDLWAQQLRSKVGDFDMLFTGNSWVQDICTQSKIPCTWIDYHVDISATEIRRLLSRWSDVSKYAIISSLPR